jgi:hypothetical protein
VVGPPKIPEDNTSFRAAEGALPDELLELLLLLDELAVDESVELVFELLLAVEPLLFVVLTVTLVSTR